jgi:hypothetical protein
LCGKHVGADDPTCWDSFLSTLIITDYNESDGYIAKESSVVDRKSVRSLTKLGDSRCLELPRLSLFFCTCNFIFHPK